MKRFNKLVLILSFLFLCDNLQSQIIYSNYGSKNNGIYFDTTNILGVRQDYKMFLLLGENKGFDEQYEIFGDYRNVMEYHFLINEFYYLVDNNKDVFKSISYLFPHSYSRYKNNGLRFFVLGKLPTKKDYQTYVVGVSEERLKRQVLLLLTIRNYDIASIVEVAEYCDKKGFPIDVNTQIDEEGIFHIEKKGYDISLLFYPKKLQRQYKKDHPDNSIIKQSFYLDDAGRVQIIN